MSWLPPPDEVVELPVDELALHILRSYVDGGMTNLHRGNASNLSSLRILGEGYVTEPIARAVGEAFDWLLLHGLVAVNPGESTGFGYVTARGLAMAADRNAAATVRAAVRIGVDMHSRIADRVRRQFLLGEFEAAVLIAFREVEIRVRDLGGFSDSVLGVPLMLDAFNPDRGGPLVDHELDGGEQKAWMFLFAGAIGAFKNPSSHRQVDYEDATIAAEAVLLADLLLRMLDRYDADTAALDEAVPR